MSNKRLSRRQFTVASGTAIGTLALAGCTGNGDDNGVEDEETNGDDGVEDEETNGDDGAADSDDEAGDQHVLSVTVVSEDGEELEDVTVFAETETGSRIAAVTDESGVAELELASGEYPVFVEHDEYGSAAETADVPEDDELTLTLE